MRQYLRSCWVVAALIASICTGGQAQASTIDDWSGLSLEELANLPKTVRDNGMETAAFEQALANAAWPRISEHLEHRLSPNEALPLLKLIARTGPHLSTTNRNTLKTRLGEMIGRDLLVTIDFEGLLMLRTALASLGTSIDDTRPLSKRWIESSDQWRALDATTLRQLLRLEGARVASTSGAEPLEQVVAHVKHIIFSDHQGAIGGQSSETIALIAWLGWYLPQPVRQQFLDDVLAFFLGEDKYVGTLDFDAALELRLALFALTPQQPEHYASAIPAWLATVDALDDLSITQMCLLAHVLTLDADRHAPSAAALQEIAAFAYTEYMSGGAVDELSDDEMHSLVATFAPHLEEVQRNELARLVLTRFVNAPDALVRMNESETLEVAGMLRRLSGKPAHARLYARWCNADNRWQEMDLDALGRALRHIDVDADTDPASHTLRENMTNRMVELLSPRHQLRDHRNLALITSFHHHFSQQQTTQLTNVLLSEVRQVLSEPAFTFSFEYTTACEAAFEKLGVSKDVLASLNLRAEYIWRRSDTFPPRVALRESTESFYGYQGYYWGIHHVAVVECDNATAVTLRERLESARSVNPPAAMVISWRNRYGDTKVNADWKRLLAARGADPSLSGDERAGWLLARAYAEEIEPDEPTPLRGRKWIEQALGEATTPTIQIAALTWLAQGHIALGEFEAATTLLASIADSSGEWKETQQSLARQIDEAKRGRQRQQTISDDYYADQRRDELRRRLELARERNDVDRVKRLEAQLSTFDTSN